MQQRTAIRLRKIWSNFTYIIIALLFVILGLNALLHFSTLWINVSHSLPVGVYETAPLDRGLKRGELVLTCLPEHAVDLAFARGYVTTGQCRHTTAPVGKYLVGLPGDHVRVSHQGIEVNGRILRATVPMPRDGNGQELSAARLDRRLGPGEYVVANAGPRSYDSRYFGVVRERQLIARIRPWLVLG